MDSFRDPELGPRLWQFFAFAFAFSTFFSGFALFAERRFTHNGVPFGTKEVGYLFAFSGLIGALIQGGGMGRLVKTFGESRLVQLGFATMALSFAIMAGINGIPLLLVAIALLTFGSAVLRPSLTSLITKTRRAERNQQGMIIGLMQSLTSIAQIIAPVIAGLLIQALLLKTWAVAGSLFSAAGWAVTLMMP